MSQNLGNFEIFTKLTYPAEPKLSPTDKWQLTSWQVKTQLLTSDNSPPETAPASYSLKPTPHTVSQHEYISLPDTLPHDIFPWHLTPWYFNPWHITPLLHAPKFHLITSPWGFTHPLTSHQWTSRPWHLTPDTPHLLPSWNLPPHLSPQLNK